MLLGGAGRRGIPRAFAEKTLVPEGMAQAEAAGLTPVRKRWMGVQEGGGGMDVPASIPQSDLERAQ